MRHSLNNGSRESRRQELIKMLRDRNRQAEVLKLCREALPPGQELTAGMSIIDVILDREFGPTRADGVELPLPGRSNAGETAPNAPREGPAPE